MRFMWHSQQPFIIVSLFTFTKIWVHCSLCSARVFYHFSLMPLSWSQEIVHPPGNIVPVIGNYSKEHGCSYVVYTCCYQQVQINAVLCIQKEEIVTSHERETKKVCYILVDQIDQCCAWFLRSLAFSSRLLMWCCLNTAIPDNLCFSINFIVMQKQQSSEWQSPIRKRKLQKR